jgi:UDP-N-acetylmuramoyl-L-alanyl-D-glutamate--2,6-diaminopimelate ligase
MTAPKQLSELCGDRQVFHLHGDGDTLIESIEYDSRLVKPGGLFVAMSGGYVDGHDFVPEAVGRGAVAVLAERHLEVDVATVVVDNTRARLPEVAARFFDYPSQQLRVIGITGTDGKTTTSFLVDSILSIASLRTGLVGTVAVKIGDETVQHETRQTTPESLEVQRLLRQMVESGVEWVILEATSHGLALYRLDEIVFDIAAVTNITHEHLDFHGSVEAYREAKSLLFKRLEPDNGVAIINSDDAGAREMERASSSRHVVRYGLESPAASITAEIMASDVSGTLFQIETPYGKGDVALPYPGKFNVENALCAASIALSAGVDLDTVCAGLASAKPVAGRMVSVDEGQPFAVVVDYAHTPESLTKILNLLRELTDAPGRLICVSGSAGERDRAKRPMQGKVSATLADISIFTSEDPRFEDPEAIIREIAKGAEMVGRAKGSDYFEVVDRFEAIGLAMTLAAPGDTALLAGKGHEQSIIVGDQKVPWDEASVARQILRQRGYSRSSKVTS